MAAALRMVFAVGRLRCTAACCGVHVHTRAESGVRARVQALFTILPFQVALGLAAGVVLMFYKSLNVIFPPAAVLGVLISQVSTPTCMSESTVRTP